MSVLALLACALLLLVLGFVWTVRAQRVAGFPSPAWYPILGNYFVLTGNMERWHDWVFETSRSFSFQPWTFGIPTNAPVVVIPPSEEWAEWLLKGNFENFDKGSTQRGVFDDLLGEGIFQTSGEVWFHQRKLASHIFSVRQLRDYMTGVFQHHSSVFCELLERAADDGAVVDLQAMFFGFTLDSFAEIAFGENLESLRRPSEFGAAFDTAQSLINARFFDPSWRLKRALGIGSEARIAEALRVINAFADTVIARKITEQRAVAGGAADQRACDILALYAKDAIAKGVELPVRDMRDTCINFMIAGRDTTATALSWQFFELMTRPQVLAKLRSEIDSALGDAAADYESVQRLDYAQALFNETLRLHPSVPSDAKTSIAEDTAPNGVRIPPNTGVMYSPYLFGRSEALWGPDAGDFKPERWLGAPQPSRFKFISFNAGPRTCLGIPVANLEAKLLTAAIVQRFELELVAPEEVAYALTVTLPMRNGLRVRVHRRK
eukprot:Amastigsp_a178387_34.p2 type:complete len:493 gc:universal Amastigsp_a178387_34:1488-10(-)